MKPEPDHPICLDCGEKILNREKAVVTPDGLYHKKCDYPSPEVF